MNINNILMEKLETQSSNLEETLATIEEINASVQEINIMVNNSAKGNTENIKILEDFTDKTLNLGISIDTLAQYGEKTMSIVKSTNDVNNQIKLLSLNTSIESSRTIIDRGSMCVIANELKKLSDKSKEESQNIANILKDVENCIIKTKKDMESVKEDIIIMKQNANSRTQNIHILNNNMNEISSAIEELSKISEIQANDFQEIIKDYSNIK